MSKTHMILSRQFDIDGNGIGRVVRLCGFARFVPIGNLRGGPGLRCLLVLLVLHFAGRQLFSILIRQEQRLQRMYQLIAGGR